MSNPASSTRRTNSTHFVRELVRTACILNRNGFADGTSNFGTSTRGSYPSAPPRVATTSYDFMNDELPVRRPVHY